MVLQSRDTSGPKGKVSAPEKGMGLVNEVFDEEDTGEAERKYRSRTCADILQQEQLPCRKCPAAGIKLCERYAGTRTQWKSGQCAGTEKRTGIYRCYFSDDDRFRGDRLSYCKGAAEGCRRAEEAVRLAMKKIKGAYALVVSSPRKLIGARDPFGLKPFMYRQERKYIFPGIRKLCNRCQSDAEFVRDVEPGEIVTITKDGIASDMSMAMPAEKQARCIFEYIYFARTRFSD